MDDTTQTGDNGEMTFAEKRHDQLTTAPEAEEKDAAPRIEVTQTPEGNKRIDWRDDAPVRPGGAEAVEQP